MIELSAYLSLSGKLNARFPMLFIPLVNDQVVTSKDRFSFFVILTVHAVHPPGPVAMPITGPAGARNTSEHPRLSISLFFYLVLFEFLIFSSTSPS